MIDLTRERCLAIYDAVAAEVAAGHAFGYGQPAAQNAADKLGVKHKYVRQAVKTAQKLYGRPHPNGWVKLDGMVKTYNDIIAENVPKIAKTPPAAPDAPADPLVVRRLREDNASKAQYIGELEKKVITLEDIRGELMALGPINRSRVSKPAVVNTAGNRGRSVVLHISDIQYGEVVDLIAVDGVNSYDSAIANRRIGRYFATSHRLITDLMKTSRVDEIIILLNGDMISGALHDELAKTDDVKPMTAAKMVAENLCGGIQLLLEIGLPIRAISTVGNHGRTTLKPESKGHTLNSYDTLVAWFIEAFFKTNPAFTIKYPASVDALFSIYGFPCLVTHGDRMGSSGGRGFIGASATIIRGHRKLLADYSGRGIHLYKIFTGHLHTSFLSPFGQANGSMAGWSEYAQSFRFDQAPPLQGYCVFHEEHGLIEYREINCGHESEGTSCSPASIYKPHIRPLAA